MPFPACRFVPGRGPSWTSPWLAKSANGRGNGCRSSMLARRCDTFQPANDSRPTIQPLGWLRSASRRDRGDPGRPGRSGWGDVGGEDFARLSKIQGQPFIPSPGREQRPGPRRSRWPLTAEAATRAVEAGELAGGRSRRLSRKSGASVKSPAGQEKQEVFRLFDSGRGSSLRRWGCRMSLA